MMLVCVYEAGNMLLVPPLDSKDLIAPGPLKDEQPDGPEPNKHGTKYAFADMDLGSVNKYLYAGQQQGHGQRQRTNGNLT